MTRQRRERLALIGVALIFAAFLASLMAPDPPKPRCQIIFEVGGREAILGVSPPCPPPVIGR